MIIGGDDSVAWSVTHPGALEVDMNNEKGKLHERYPNQNAVNVRRAEGFAEGRDPVDTNGKYFLIEIKLPKVDRDRDDFLADLRAAVNNPTSDNKIRFWLQIEAQNYDQISVDWPRPKNSTQA